MQINSHVSGNRFISRIFTGGCLSFPRFWTGGFRKNVQKQIHQRVIRNESLMVDVEDWKSRIVRGKLAQRCTDLITFRQRGFFLECIVSERLSGYRHKPRGHSWSATKRSCLNSEHERLGEQYYYKIRVIISLYMF